MWYTLPAFGGDLAGLPDTFYRVAWPSVRDAILSDLRATAQPPLEVAMRHLFAWDPVAAEAEAVAETPRDLLRLYYHLVRENERLPEVDQLSLEDLGLVRDTLRATVQRRKDVQRMVDSLFRLVQRKVETAHVSQAWLMLQMFDYDRSVRLWNERNLYLEEMTLRFADPKDSQADIVAPDLSDAISRLDEGVEAAVEAVELLGEETGIDLMLFGVDADEQVAWKELWEAATPGGETSEQEELLERGRYRKWRPLREALAHAPDELTSSTLSAEALRHHLLDHAKAVYFLLLVANPTGWESYIPALFGWLFERTDGVSADAFSELHRIVTMEEASIREALDSVYVEKVEPVFLETLAACTPAGVLTSLRGLLDSLSGASLGGLPPGRYSLNGLLLDRLLGVVYPAPRLAWHVHRLM